MIGIAEITRIGQCQAYDRCTEEHLQDSLLLVNHACVVVAEGLPFGTCIFTTVVGMNVDSSGKPQIVIALSLSDRTPPASPHEVQL